MLYLQNTLTGLKEIFTPIVSTKVTIYVCGVTLYDDIHIGHLKSILTFEILRNYFQSQGLEVTLVRNITDIDDKIILKAVEQGKDPLDLVNGYIDSYHQLLVDLEIKAPDFEPRVTEFLPQIANYITKLENTGFAYKANDGIYFDTKKISNAVYPLSKKVINSLQESSDNSMYDKKHPSDFALWKKDVNHGYRSDIFPHRGRPGWHIECSAMHHHTLGEKFDIHGGGRDLIFPHHENEITQSIAHNGVNPANYWIHNGMMTKDGKKLSKSIGNSIYVHDLLKDYSPEGIKLFLLKGQYHQSQEFSEEELVEANLRMGQLMSSLNRLENVNFQSALPQFFIALEDNLNTPKIVTLIYQRIRELTQTYSRGLAEEILTMLKILSVVGESQTLESLYEKWEDRQKASEEIVELAEQRNLLKYKKDWNGADNLRELIKAKGWSITDKKDGSYQLSKL